MSYLDHSRIHGPDRHSLYHDHGSTSTFYPKSQQMFLTYYHLLI
nr:MAG TPA: hypothetical protein [Caudoviricetes sp.]